MTHGAPAGRDRRARLIDAQGAVNRQAPTKKASLATRRTWPPPASAAEVIDRGRSETIAPTPRFDCETHMHIDGACHCGAIGFSAEIDPARVMVCHCSDCQVLSGAPFRAVVAAPIETLVVRGEPQRYVKVAASGNRRAQVFCPVCATPLFATAPENATSVVIRLGCVTQRAELVPSAQIWQHSALPWLSELHRVPGSPEQQAFLPAAPRADPLPPGPRPDA